LKSEIPNVRLAEIGVSGKIFADGIVEDKTMKDLLESAQPTKPVITEETLKTSIETLELSARAINGLKRNAINTIDDLIKISELELINKKYIGLNTAKEIIVLLRSKGINLKTSEEEEEDPKEELINRLIEYQKYKELSAAFKDLEFSRQELFGKNPSYLDEFKEDGIIIDNDITLDDLLKAFANFNVRKENDKPLNTTITKKEYSVSERSHDIMNRLKKYKKIEFTELFEVVNKEYVVVTFLSILDLARKGHLNIKQDKNLSQIFILARGEN